MHKDRWTTTSHWVFRQCCHNVAIKYGSGNSKTGRW